MECCYFNKGYLAEPTNEQEQNKIVEYITAGKSYLLLLDHDKMKLILSKICIIQIYFFPASYAYNSS